MSDMSYDCAKAQVTAHIPRRRIRSGTDRGNGSPKPLDWEIIDGVLYNCAAAPHAAHLCHFALSSSISALALPNPHQRKHSLPILIQTGENGAEKGSREAEENGRRSQPRRGMGAIEDGGGGAQ